MKGIPESACILGSDTGDNNNKLLINHDITNILEYLIHTNKNCNGCIRKPPQNNPTYGIVDTGATKNYIKVDTPFSNKFKTTQVPQVILPYGSLIQTTHTEELNLIILLSTRAKNHTSSLTSNQGH